MCVFEIYAFNTMEVNLKFVLLFHFITLTTHCHGQLLTPVLSTSDGKLRGLVQANIFNETIFAYLGVPYGNPPTGNQRFKVPDPVRPWKGVIDVTKDRGPCYNRDTFYENNNAIVGEENCLVLNVFTKPVKLRRNLKPVMVFIEGGGFTTDSIEETIFDPTFLLTKDVVVVVISYRLGLLGFLSLEDPSLEVPGNAGLKDQILALKWVQKNIQNFGGDPNSVTLCGESAGAASVHYHILSPASRGLFQKAILQSGSALCPWALGKSNGQLVGEALGVPNASEKEVLSILRNMTGYEIFLVQEKVFDPAIYGTVRPFVPVIERNSRNAVITRYPFEYISEGDYSHVPLLIGYNSNEGILFDWLKGVAPTIAEAYNYSLAIPWYMHVDERQSQIIIDIMRRTYSPFSDPIIKDLLVMDSTILAPIAAMIKNHFRTSRYVPIYAYRTSVETRRNFFKVTKNLQYVPGVANGDDVGFLWNTRELPRVIPQTLEALTVFRFVELWTNFARFGNPTPNDNLGVTLPPIDDENIFDVLEIERDLTILKDLPERDRIHIWREIYRQSPYTANYL